MRLNISCVDFLALMISGFTFVFVMLLYGMLSHSQKAGNSSKEIKQLQISQVLSEQQIHQFILIQSAWPIFNAAQVFNEKRE